MKSPTTTQFRKMFADLPEQVQEQTRKAYRQFKQDPSYPNLRFKKVHAELPIYSARINRDYRAVGQLDEETVIWFWAGSHAEYDMLLDQS
ncbi:type II toxin-antitoxin system RelE/ParE family toxin [uncultured Nostoc sp.]|uniref:type II toxin-antitoxin system RelE family toxin n=1 Tax=uncultured Nostoc sp. TaxID=340711 RepID=UPI0035CAA6EA